MAKVEIDENELVTLRAALKLFNDMSSDRSAKPLLEGAVKKIRPDYVTEDERTADLAKPYVEQLNTLKEEFSAYKKSNEEERNKVRSGEQEQSLLKDLERVRKAYNFTEDGMKKVTDLMVKSNIADPEAAALLLNKRSPEVQTTAYEPAGWNLAPDDSATGGPSMKDWVQDTERTREREIVRTLNEVRAARAAAA